MTTQPIPVLIDGEPHVITFPALTLAALQATPPPDDGGGTTTPPPSGKAPFPKALAGHALVSEYLPGDLYAWRFQADGKTPVTNASGVSEDPASPRNVSVASDSGVQVLRLATTSVKDCGVIQSPGKFPTDSGVIEALVKFSGFQNNGHFFANWASLWMYGPSWPSDGEIDAVETSYGNSFVGYHYGKTDTEASTNPWQYATKSVQLQPVNVTSVPAAPNILPDAWTHVTLAFGPQKVDVYYEGTLYTTIAGGFVTGKPMYVTAGTAMGAPGLGSNQAPYDQPGTVELQYVRVFS